MTKLKLAFCAAALMLIAAQPAEASYKVIRWSTGLCQVWVNAPWNAGPFGWRPVSPNFRTFGQAVAARHRLIMSGHCW